MKKNYLTSIVAACITTFSFSQGIEWEFNLVSAAANNSIESLERDNSNNIIIGGKLQGTIDFDHGPGTAELTSNGLYDGYIAKYDEDGNYIWAYTIGGEEDDELVSDIVIDQNDNIYIAGFYTGTCDFDFGTGEQSFTSSPMGVWPNPYILKIDANGNFQWVKTFAPGNIGGTKLQLAMAIDDENNLVVGGKYYANPTMYFYIDPTNENSKLKGSFGNHYILKLTNNGDFVWVKPIKATTIMSIDTDAANNIYIAGEYLGTNDMDPDTTVVVDIPTYGLTDLFISKLNDNGIYQWSHGYGSGMVDYTGEVVVDALGTSNIVGYVAGAADVDPSANEHLVSGAFIFQYSSNGDLNWGHGFPTGTGLFSDVALDANNNLAITGYLSNSVDMDPGAGDSTINFSYSQHVVLKLTNSGDFIYALALEDRVVNPDLAIATDGSIFVGNRIYPAGGLSVLKINDDGSGTVGIDKIQPEEMITAYPNPGSESVILQNKTNLDLEVRFLNHLGQEVITTTQKGGDLVFFTNHLAPGVYFIKVTANGNSQMVKWIKE